MSKYGSECLVDKQMTDKDSFSQEQVPLILVVDDDRSMRTLLKVAMQEEGYRVVEAKNGEQCLVEYERWHPDMVLLDGMMPEMDGFTCCQQLRNLLGGEHLPILMITVLDDQDSIEQAFTVGATDYITKPIYWAVLSQRVKRLLAGSQALLEAEQVKDQLRQQLEWENLFEKITRQLCQPFNLEQFLASTVALIQSVAKVERVILYQYNNKILFEAFTPGYPSVKNISLPDLGLETYYQTKYERGQLVAIDDLSQVDLSEQDSALLTQIQTQAALMIPILVAQKVWGILCIHQCQTPHPWKSWQARQFSLLANLLAIAINLSST